MPKPTATPVRDMRSILRDKIAHLDLGEPLSVPLLQEILRDLVQEVDDLYDALWRATEGE